MSLANHRNLAIGHRKMKTGHVLFVFGTKSLLGQIVMPRIPRMNGLIAFNQVPRTEPFLRTGEKKKKGRKKNPTSNQPNPKR